MISTSHRPISSAYRLSSCTLLTRSEVPSSLNSKSKSKSTATTVLRGVYGSTHREGRTPGERVLERGGKHLVDGSVKCLLFVWSEADRKSRGGLGKEMARDRFSKRRIHSLPE